MQYIYWVKFSCSRLVCQDFILGLAELQEFFQSMKLESAHFVLASVFFGTYFLDSAPSVHSSINSHCWEFFLARLNLHYNWERVVFLQHRPARPFTVLNFELKNW